MSEVIRCDVCGKVDTVVTSPPWMRVTQAMRGAVTFRTMGQSPLLPVDVCSPLCLSDWVLKHGKELNGYPKGR